MYKTFTFLDRLNSSLNGYLFDGEGDPGSGAAPETAATPAPATQGAPAAAPATTTAPPSSATTTQAPPGEGWIPSYRAREIREAAQRQASESFAQKEAQYRSQLEQVQTQLRALVGVQAPKNPEVDAIKSQFANLYPGLSKMEERAAQLEQLLERAGDLETQTNHYWQSYGQQAMTRLFDHASQSLGAPLTDEGKRALHASFTGFVQSSPELTERYANDPTLVEDFWKAFSSSFIEPVRRSSTATIQGRAAAVAGLPQDSRSGGVQTTPVPKPANIDERAANAWELYKATAKQ